MDNQLAKPEILIHKVAWLLLAAVMATIIILFGIHQVRISDPYVKSVLELPGNPAQGHAIFQMNCSGCHGLQADGHVGPSLRHVSDRKSRVALIYQVTSGKTPPMPQFQPSSQEMADLLKYLESL
ncbi:cytochrome C [Neosynechococcus sphagnicola sy1]|uniref:Cytochrome C n=1 Tax=Neosynechococcus sphagnicola sy1 TaxID=1497020 RepID=A0A098TM21_9CYAN|nr:cytochrome c [Neosynechococcus sphagnicola]KGF73311.1 cytochrome C [Neosynechococcus sphagnicola sy1]